MVCSPACSKSGICCYSDLQTITRDSQAALASHQARSRSRTVTTLPDAQDTEALQGRSTTPEEPLARAGEASTNSLPAPVLEEISEGGGLLHELVEHAVPITRVQRSDDTEVDPELSDEDYEEDIIEPRTLNEITTVTDKTSPWSSFTSDMSGEVISPQPNEVQREGSSCPPGPFPREELKVRSSLMSSPQKAVNPQAGRGSPSHSIACEGGAYKTKVEESASAQPLLVPGLTVSGAKESNDSVGWGSPQKKQDKRPMPEILAERETFSSEFSDSSESFEKFPLYLPSQSKRENLKEPPMDSPSVRQEQVTTGPGMSTRQSLLLYPLLFPTKGTKAIHSEHCVCWFQANRECM